MPLSQANNRLYTRSSQLVGQNAAGLDIDGLSDIGEAIADADLFIIDNGGGGTNTKTAVTRIPTYVFSGISGAITINSSGVASFGTNAEGTNLTLSGNLTVNGTTTNVSSTTVTIDDPLFALADNNSADSVDIGWYGKYVDSGTKYSGLFRDASDSDMWKLFANTGNSNAAPSTTVDTTSGFTLANLSVNELTGTIATAAQGNITSLGTLSALTVDDVAIDGKIVTMTGSSGDTATITVGTNGTLDITTTDTAAAAANIQITADGTAELAGTTVTLDSEGGITLDANGGTITFSDDGVSLGTITSSGYSGTSAVATVATTVTITDNESTDEDNAVVFTAGGDVDGGNLGLESDGNLTYNPSSGTLSATLLAGTVSTASQGSITTLAGLTTIGTVSNALAMTYSDVTLFHDANNADTSFSIGTSATEALKIEVLNGGSNKTAEAVHFSTATASSTADHGKMVFDIDGSDILTIDDGGISIAASGAYEVDGTAILSDSSGTMTLSNVDALDATTEATVESAIDTLANLTAAGSVANALALTYSDVTLFHDANDADTSFTIGTSATEALKIEVLNGGSNKTAEEVHFSTATASSTSDHGKMVFDIDGTDVAEIDDSGINLASGKTFRVNGSAIATSDTTYTAGDLLDLDGTEFDVDLTEAGEAAIANGDYILFLDGGATGTHAKENIADVATLFAGTGLTASSSVIAVDSSQAITALTGGDLTIYEDANNADVSLKMGTSATESLTIEVLNGSSNKTAESVTFTTATASGTADHGKFTFNVDGTDIFDVDDSGINLASGKSFRINGTTIDGDITGVTAGNGLSGGGTDGAITLALDLSELTDTAIANGDYIVFTDTTDSNATVKGDLADVATLFAGTGLTASSSVIGVDASQAINALTGGDLTIYDDANNADVSFKMGTSATEALSIEVLNGSSNKTAESVTFSTATASSTSDHGKFTFNVDGTDIFDVDDSGINLASGKSFRINGTAIDGDITSVVAGTGLSGGGTDGDVTLNVEASQAITALTGGDLTIYEDANNADVSLKLGTSATESLSIEVLNGSSNKTAEEIHFSTATASGTADHGKMVFDIDGTDILTIDDGGLVVKTTGTIGPVGDEDLVTLTASGSIVTVAGELSATTLDIGGTNISSTAGELNLLDGDTSVGGSITLADDDGVVVNDGGTMKTIPASDIKTYASGDSATKGFAIAMAVAL